MSVLVAAEHDGTSLAENFGTAVEAASRLDQEILALVAGSGAERIAELASQNIKISKVLAAEDPSGAQIPASEDYADLIAKHASEVTHVIMADSSFAKQVLPYAAALCDVQMLTSVVEIIDKETFVRPVYAGNFLAKIKCTAPVKFLSVRPTSFMPETNQDAKGAAQVTTISDIVNRSLSRRTDVRATQSTRPDLVTASIVVSGGRGLGGAEGFALLEKLADKLGAAVGATRAAVDAGFAPNDWQVGQTGKIVAPELYIGIGISGAVQHLAGIKDARIVVAINRDPDAPLMQIANYSIAGDGKEKINELLGSLP